MVYHIDAPAQMTARGIHDANINVHLLCTHTTITLMLYTNRPPLIFASEIQRRSICRAQSSQHWPHLQNLSPSPLP